MSIGTKKQDTIAIIAAMVKMKFVLKKLRIFFATATIFLLWNICKLIIIISQKIFSTTKNRAFSEKEKCVQIFYTHFIFFVVILSLDFFETKSMQEVLELDSMLLDK